MVSEGFVSYSGQGIKNMRTCRSIPNKGFLKWRYTMNKSSILGYPHLGVSRNGDTQKWMVCKCLWSGKFHLEMADLGVPHDLGPRKPPWLRKPSNCCPQPQSPASQFHSFHSHRRARRQGSDAVQPWGPGVQDSIPTADQWIHGIR